MDNITQSGVLAVGISDHLVIYCTRKVTRVKSGCHKCVKVRSLKKYTKDQFNELLMHCGLDCIYDISNVNEAYAFFKDKFVSILNTLAPIKEIRIKQDTEPWMCSEILDLIKQRDHYLKMFKQSKSSTDIAQHHMLRNQVTHKIKKAKAQFIKTSIVENKGNPTQLWRVLQDLGCSKKCKTKETSIGINIDNSICFDKVKVATHFNSFFSDIAGNLVDKLPPIIGKYGYDFVKKFYLDKVSMLVGDFSFTPVSQEHVHKMLIGLNSHKATGLDGMPARFIIDSADIICKPLCHIVNLSIQSGEFPCDIKKAKITPIYKKKAKTEAGNYRPVSVLSTISKIIEKIACEQLTEYLDSNRLLYELQSGFRSSFSTDSCLIHLSDFIRKQQDKGYYTGMVILDLQKAFDTVNHKILLEKLRAMGVGEIAVQWFNSYLSGRQQLVNIGDTNSDFRNVLCGVPQGSILGPLLFLVYVNDMKAAVKCKLLLYADDSALLVSGKDVLEIERILSVELGAVNEWLCENRLSLHLGKTQSILFGSKKCISKCSELHVTCNGSVIGSESEVTYLGAILDQTLSGASTIITKSTNKLKFLYRNARPLDSKSKAVLTSALIQCHFDYASAIWYSGLTQTFKTKLQIVQNKIIRFILDLPARSHVGYVEFSKAKMFPVHKRVEQLKMNHMFNIIHGNSPAYLKEDISLQDNTSHQTRSVTSLSCQTPRVNSFGLRSFFYTAIIKCWNSLPFSLRSINTKQLYKNNLKKSIWNQLRTENQELYIYY